MTIAANKNGATEQEKQNNNGWHQCRCGCMTWIHPDDKQHQGDLDTKGGATP
jgi:hypothetical protein